MMTVGFDEINCVYLAMARDRYLIYAKHIHRFVTSGRDHFDHRHTNGADFIIN